MAIVPTNLDSGGGTPPPGGAATQNTNSVSISAGALIVVSVVGTAGSGFGQPNPGLPTLSGDGVTWTQVADVTETDGGNVTRTTVFSGVSSSSTSGALTFSWTVTPVFVAWSVDQFAGASAVIPQAVTGTNGGAETFSLSITLAALQAGSLSFGAFGNTFSGPPALMPGSGYTQLGQAATTVVATMLTEYQSPGSTTVNATASNLGDWAGVALEIQLPPTTPAWGWAPSGEVAQAPKPARRSATKGRADFAIFANPVRGADIFNNPPTRQPRFAPSAAAASGPTQVFAPPAGTPNLPDGREVQAPPPQRRRQERAASSMRGDDGSQGKFNVFVGAGSIVQPPQPPQPRTKRFGAIVVDDDGDEAPYIVWRPHGWVVPSPQPPHPRPERAAAVMPSSFVEVPYANWRLAGWQFEAFQAKCPTWWRGGPSIRGDDGAALPFAVWYAPGWEVQAVQPGHPRPERAGALAWGDAGAEAPSVPPAGTVTWGYEAPQAVSAARSRQRGAGIEGRSDYAASSLLPWWESTVANDRHPRPERAAAVLIEDLEQIFGPQSAVGFGWNPALPAPSRARRPTILGTFGVEARFSVFHPAGWQVADPFLVRPAPWRGAGALSGRDDGDEAPFVPPNPTAAWWQAELPIFPRRWAKFAAAFAMGDPTVERSFAVAFYAVSTVATPRSSTSAAGPSALTEIGAASSRTVVKGDPYRR